MSNKSKGEQDVSKWAKEIASQVLKQVTSSTKTEKHNAKWDEDGEKLLKIGLDHGDSDAELKERLDRNSKFYTIKQIRTKLNNLRAADQIDDVAWNRRKKPGGRGRGRAVDLESVTKALAEEHPNYPLGSGFEPTMVGVVGEGSPGGDEDNGANTMDVEEASSEHQAGSSSVPKDRNIQAQQQQDVQPIESRRTNIPALIDQGLPVTDFDIVAPSGSFHMLRWIAYKKSIYLNVLPPIGSTMSVAVFDDHVYLRFKSMPLNKNSFFKSLAQPSSLSRMWCFLTS